MPLNYILERFLKGRYQPSPCLIIAVTGFPDRFYFLLCKRFLPATNPETLFPGCVFLLIGKIIAQNYRS
jgi:hypothetical protein